MSEVPPLVLHEDRGGCINQKREEGAAWGGEGGVGCGKGGEGL
jgi:hypothetical protein